MELNRDLEAVAIRQGADRFGVADLSALTETLRAQGGDLAASYPRAVSFGVDLVDGTVDELPRHEDPVAIRTYKGLYDTVNRRLEQIALSVAGRIEQAGFRAWPVFNIIIDQRRLIGSVSHKLAAHMAGLGWIGRSCLLITPGHGPRLRLGTVLTDAPLECGKPMDSQCGDCRECVDICPVHAFTGRAFDPAEPREARYDAHKCKQYTDGRQQRIGEGLCGLCVYACPHGRRGPQGSRASSRG
jgi:epoxyqueuosine reductase